MIQPRHGLGAQSAPGSMNSVPVSALHLSPRAQNIYRVRPTSLSPAGAAASPPSAPAGPAAPPPAAPSAPLPPPPPPPPDGHPGPRWWDGGGEPIYVNVSPEIVASPTIAPVMTQTQEPAQNPIDEIASGLTSALFPSSGPRWWLILGVGGGLLWFFSRRQKNKTEKDERKKKRAS